MWITDLTPKGKRQTIVWIDGEPAGFLDNREVSAYRLSVDSEIDEAGWDRIVRDSILPRGKRKALELLQLQDRTTKELHDKLVAGDYTEAQTWEIIAYVASFRYIDEQRYAMNYIRSHVKTKSVREMRQTLLQRGVSAEIFETAYEKFAQESADGEQESESPELIAARRFAERRVRGGSLSYEARTKLYAALARKGFSQDTIRSVLEEYPGEDADGDQE